MSPEMLSIALAAHKETPAYDRRKRSGADRASDVWSVGCLLYEIISGEFLFFFDGNWAAFFAHVTGDAPIVPDAAREVLQHNNEVIRLLEFILVRNPSRRPTVSEVVAPLSRIYLGLSR